MSYVIICRVSGGITGTRESELKSDGAIEVFETKELADLKAKELTNKMNNAYSLARFQYWSEPRSRI